jgi:hypothetical protein
MTPNMTEAKTFLQELKDRTDQARKSGNLFMMNLYTELLSTTTSLIVKAVTSSEDEGQASTSTTDKDLYDQAPRHLIILPTPHEETLRLKEKLLTFKNHGWKVRDFGAFGAFEWGFIILEIEELQGYHNFKRDICSLVEQGLKYVYPEHIVCWL